MQNNLLSIFKAITPDNIKSIPVIEDSMRMFIELLNENSQISKNIMNVLSENTTDSIAEELPKIYLYDYYSMIDNIKKDKIIVNKFEKWNEALNPTLYPKGYPIIGNSLFINYFAVGEPGGILTIDADETENETFNTFPFAAKLNALEHNILQHKADNYRVNRLFKESKGLRKGIQFIYDILNEHLVNVDERLELDFNETGNPFELIIKGSIDKDVYRESVAYLSHPLGFVYDYTYISELRLKDDYSLSKNYVVKTLEVRCLSGNVDPYTQRVINIEEKFDYLKITFLDGSYLLQENDIVRYYDKDDFLIKLYSANNHCSIFIDYIIEYNTSLTDDVRFKWTKTFEPDIVPEMLDDVRFRETLEFKKNFIIGLSVIGEDYISNDTDLFNAMLLDEFFKSSEYSSFIDSTGEILDETAFDELLRFKRNFVIGVSNINTIDADLITSDTDAVDPNLITDTVTINKNNTNDEIYNITDLNEEFLIEVY